MTYTWNGDRRLPKYPKFDWNILGMVNGRFRVDSPEIHFDKTYHRLYHVVCERCLFGQWILWSHLKLGWRKPWCFCVDPHNRGVPRWLTKRMTEIHDEDPDNFKFDSPLQAAAFVWLSYRLPREDQTRIYKADWATEFSTRSIVVEIAGKTETIERPPLGYKEALRQMQDGTYWIEETNAELYRALAR